MELINKNEIKTKEQQLKKVAELEQQMKHLLGAAEGCFFIDHGYQPTPLVQSRLRFKEAMMWLRSWIEASN